MFSENEIAMQCSQCKGHCDELKKCPLKIEWTAVRESRMFPFMPSGWKLSDTGNCTYLPESDNYTTEELIKGLSKLSGHL
ncbi:MAG: hypothetical protein HZC49_06285 [Nitrospirae bacterium]|nr:hypothetical protein [Nitrospirota bacterium]